MTGPELRIGDAEREAAVQALGEHYAAGRLTKDEFDERSGQAYDARTASALHPLFADLPGRPQPGPPPGAHQGPPHGQVPPQWHQRRRSGSFLKPVLVVVLALVLLAHLPLLFVLLLGWAVFAHVSGRWARHAAVRHQRWMESVGLRPPPRW